MVKGVLFVLLFFKWSLLSSYFISVLVVSYPFSPLVHKKTESYLTLFLFSYESTTLHTYPGRIEKTPSSEPTSNSKPFICGGFDEVGCNSEGIVSLSSYCYLPSLCVSISMPLRLFLFPSLPFPNVIIRVHCDFRTYHLT